MGKVYTGYFGTSEIEHGLCACMVNNPLAKAQDYLSVQAHKPGSISHLISYPQTGIIAADSSSSEKEKNIWCPI